MDGPAHLLRPASAKILGYHHPAPAARPVKKPTSIFTIGVDAPTARQRTGIHIISHHIGVYCIVELLEENFQPEGGWKTAGWTWQCFRGSCSVLSFTFCAITFRFLCVYFYTIITLQNSLVHVALSIFLHKKKPAPRLNLYHQP